MCQYFNIGFDLMFLEVQITKIIALIPTTQYGKTNFYDDALFFELTENLPCLYIYIYIPFNK